MRMKGLMVTEKGMWCRGVEVLEGCSKRAYINEARDFAIFGGSF